MKITQIDKNGRLFRVEDLLPAELLDSVMQLDWQQLPWQREDGQEMWARKSIRKEEVPELREVCQYIAALQYWLEERFQIEFEYRTNLGNTNWWVDQPGFTTPMHTDGELPLSLQMYYVGDTNLGTAFYEYNNEGALIQKFEFLPNTGYMMLNGKNPDGSQPLHWHAMLTPVPANSFRVSSYTVFPNYSHK